MSIIFIQERIIELNKKYEMVHFHCEIRDTGIHLFSNRSIDKENYVLRSVRVQGKESILNAFLRLEALTC